MSVDVNEVPAASPVNAVSPDDSASTILDRYRRFLAVERSLETVTVDRYVDCLRPFLDSRISADGLALHLGSLSPADVIAFVVARCPRQNGGSAKLTVTALRSFLGFLHLEGITARSLACVSDYAAPFAAIPAQ